MGSSSTPRITADRSPSSSGPSRAAVPITYSIASDRRYVSVIARDPVLVTEVIDAFAEMSGHASAGPGMVMYIDARDVSRVPQRSKGNAMVALRVLRGAGVERVAIDTYLRSD